MKKMIALVLVLAFGSASCTSVGARKDLMPGKKIQMIEVAKDSYFYAQDDVLLTDDSFNEGISAVSPEMAAKMKSGRTFLYLANGMALIQLSGLVVCLAVPFPTSLGWCVGSIGSGLAALSLAGRSERKTSEAVREYNSRITPQL